MKQIIAASRAIKVRILGMTFSIIAVSGLGPALSLGILAVKFAELP
jgi:hypothetical protein